MSLKGGSLCRIRTSDVYNFNLLKVDMENDSGNKINSQPKKQEKAMGYAARWMGYSPVIQSV
jgi:hypothetical protein